MEARARRPCAPPSPAFIRSPDSHFVVDATEHPPLVCAAVFCQASSRPVIADCSTLRWRRLAAKIDSFARRLRRDTRIAHLPDRYACFRS